MKPCQPYLVLVLLVSASLICCQKESESFENKVYINSPSKVGSVLFKENTINDVRTIQAAIAQPAAHDITITYRADLSLVTNYNGAFYDQAIALPSENYELPEPQARIIAGGIRSTEITVHFKDINKLDTEKTYVLPITIENANISILESARTTYYVLKGAALINVVADIEENYLHIDTWAKPEVVTDLSQITMETLIRVRNYDRMISTVMGIEGKFLIRFGDMGFPSNQIQIATSGGNFPGADPNKGLPTNKWIHIALTYDSSNGETKIYVDGNLQSEGTNMFGKVSLATNGPDGFYIGYSYENIRYLSGEISECRIWNIIRTREEIANNPYDVAPNAPGLVAYWKCNEGVGSVVKDHTGNENNLTAKSGTTLRWNPVSIPDKKK